MSKCHKHHECSSRKFPAINTCHTGLHKRFGFALTHPTPIMLINRQPPRLQLAFVRLFRRVPDNNGLRTNYPHICDEI